MPGERTKVKIKCPSYRPVHHYVGLFQNGPATYDEKTLTEVVYTTEADMRNVCNG